MPAAGTDPYRTSGVAGCCDSESGASVTSGLDGKVYGWNGRQLGWFDNGTIFDIYGLRTGFIRSKSPIPTDIEPGKPAKQVKGAKRHESAL